MFYPGRQSRLCSSNAIVVVVVVTVASSQSSGCYAIQNSVLLLLCYVRKILDNMEQTPITIPSVCLQAVRGTHNFCCTIFTHKSKLFFLSLQSPSAARIACSEVGRLHSVSLRLFPTLYLVGCNAISAMKNRSAIHRYTYYSSQVEERKGEEEKEIDVTEAKSASTAVCGTR